MQRLARIVMVMLFASGAWIAETAGETITIPTALLRIIEKVEVPAATTGILSEVVVREGQIVEKGELIGKIVDRKSRLLQKKAELELGIATQQAKNSISIQFAKKSVAVSAAELRRARDSHKKFPNSVSQTELDRLQLVFERGKLEVQQAEFKREIDRLTAQVKSNEFDTAQEETDRCRILSPLSGMVVTLDRRTGEWVDPGQTVVKIVRVDRLRVEGFVSARHAARGLVGKSAIVQVNLPGSPQSKFDGKVVFVSPEANPVNSQVRIWVEVDNQKMRLTPGLRASMSILAD